MRKRSKRSEIGKMNFCRSSLAKRVNRRRFRRKFKVRTSKMMRSKRHLYKSHLSKCLISSPSQQRTSIKGGVVTTTPLLTTFHTNNMKQNCALLVTISTQYNSVQLCIFSTRKQLSSLSQMEASISYLGIGVWATSLSISIQTRDISCIASPHVAHAYKPCFNMALKL